MARDRRRLRRTLTLVPTTVAMIDVIFILFAFFLSVSQIRKSTVKVNLPEVSDAVATGERLDAVEPVRLVITVSPESAPGRFGLDREVFHTKEKLFERLRERIARGESEGRPLVAEVITDRSSDNGTLVDLVNFLSREGVKRLEFLAVERGSPGGR